MIPRSPEPERGFVLAVLGQGADVDDELAEVKELARTAGVEPVGAIVQHRARPAQRTYVGKGKLEEVKERYRESGAESLLVDDELDPAQQRFLENALDTRVTGLFSAIQVKGSPLFFNQSRILSMVPYFTGYSISIRNKEIPSSPRRRRISSATKSFSSPMDRKRLTTGFGPSRRVLWGAMISTSSFPLP